MKGISSRRGRLYLRFLPVLVWLGAVLCVVGLFHRRTARFEVIGIARAQVHDVAATCRVRLISVPVQLFQKVNADDPVAVVNTVLDDERIEAELQTISAEIDYLEAQLKELRQNYEAEIFTRQSEWVAEMRAFTADVVAARQRIVDANVVLENDRAMLEDMKLEIKRFTIQNQAKLGTDIALYNELQAMKAYHDTLARKIKRDKGVLDKHQKELEAAEHQKEVFAKYLPNPGTKDEEAKRVIDLAKEALERRKDELKARREELVLTAPCDGFVSDIQGRVGEAVMQGVPILSITEEEPNQIIAYASEELVGRIEVRKQVELIKDTEPEQIARSEVTYIGPRVEQMPMRLWRNPNIPQWGRPMLIEIPLGMKLIPGEMVGIRGL